MTGTEPTRIIEPETLKVKKTRFLWGIVGFVLGGTTGLLLCPAIEAMQANNFSAFQERVVVAIDTFLQKEPDNLPPSYLMAHTNTDSVHFRPWMKTLQFKGFFSENLDGTWVLHKEAIEDYEKTLRERKTQRQNIFYGALSGIFGALVTGAVGIGIQYFSRRRESISGTNSIVTAPEHPTKDTPPSQAP